MTLHLRRAYESDVSFYFELRNDDIVRKSSFHSNPVTYEDHCSWFRHKLEDQDTILFVVLLEDEPVGQIRIDRSLAEGFFEVHAALVKDFRGFGHGTEAIQRACNEFFELRADVDEIYAHIQPSNDGSIRSFEKAGFERKGVVAYKNTTCIRMVLIRRFH